MHRSLSSALASILTSTPASILAGISALAYWPTKQMEIYQPRLQLMYMCLRKCACQYNSKAHRKHMHIRKLMSEGMEKLTLGASKGSWGNSCREAKAHAKAYVGRMGKLMLVLS